MTTTRPVQSPEDGHLGRLGGTVLQDTWHCLTHAQVVRRRPVRRMIHCVPIVLWRDDSGGIRAMEDRCVHRRAPLSAGKVVDGCLQCPYHGWRYDGDGACVAIPSLGLDGKIPPRFAVDTFPVQVRYGLVWVWWGEPARADPDLIPDIPWLHPDRPTGAHRVAVTYPAAQELVVENLLDLTHLDFVHGSLFGDPFGAGNEELRVEHTDEVITSWRVCHQRRPPNLQRGLTRGRLQDIYGVSQLYVRSGVWLGVQWADPPGWAVCLVMPNVPEMPDLTRSEGVLSLIGPAWYAKTLMPIGARMVARQDSRIFRLQKPAYDREDTRADKSVPADAAGLRARSLRRKLVERQAAGDFAYEPGWRGPDAAEAMRVERPA